MPCRVLVSAWALAPDSLPTASLPQTALPIAAVVAPWIFRPRSSGEWSSDRWRPLRKQDFLHGIQTTGSSRLIPHGKLSVPTQFVFLSSLNQLANSVSVFGNASSADGFLFLAFDNPVSKTHLDTGPEISICEIYQVWFENGRFGKFT